MSFIKGESDPLFRAIMEELLSRFRGRNPAGQAVGLRWRIIEGAYPGGNDPNCILFQHIDGTEWKTDLAVRPDGTDALRCVAIYNRAAAQTFADATNVIIDYNVKETDTDNAVTTGVAWKFTCPNHKGGLYHCDASLAIVFPASTAVTTFLIETLVNGSIKHRGTRVAVTTPAGGGTMDAHVSCDVVLVAGDTVAFECHQVSGLSRSSEAVAFVNRECIHRLTLGMSP